MLTFKPLRIVNSAAYALVRKVDSIAQAVVLLGLEQVRKWATLIAMSANRDKPEELARLLLKKSIGDEITLEKPDGSEVWYEILAVEYQA